MVLEDTHKSSLTALSLTSMLSCPHNSKNEGNSLNDGLTNSAPFSEQLLKCFEAIKTAGHSVSCIKNRHVSWAQQLTPVIPATQEAEIWRTAVQSHLGQIVCETLSQKKPYHQKLVERLKVKVLSSSPSTAKKKNACKPGDVLLWPANTYICKCTYICIYLAPN
jgi:hypothetical protein